jgi:hypothetical protein
METKNNSSLDLENKRKLKAEKYRLKYKAIKDSMKPLQRTILKYLNNNAVADEEILIDFYKKIMVEPKSTISENAD